MRLLFLIFLVAICACSEEDSYKSNALKTLEVDISKGQTEIKLSSVLSSFRTIPLDKGSGLDLGFVKEVLGVEGLIFVHEGAKEEIWVFDQFGNLKAKVSEQGPGPEEYGKINFFDINPKRNTIEVYDVSKGELTAYDFEGNFVDKVGIRIICRDFAITEDGDYLFYVPDEMIEIKNQLLKPGLVLLNRSGEILDHEPFGNVTYHAMITGNSIAKSDSGLYVFSNYSDTIMKVHGAEITPFLFIDYSTKMDKEAFYNPNYNVEEKNAPFLKMNVFMSDRFLGYSFVQKDDSRHLLIDLKTEEYTIGDFYKNDINDSFFFFNGGQLGTHSYASIVNQEVLESLRDYSDLSVENKARSTEMIEYLQSLLEANKYTPVLVVGNFKAD